MRSVSERRGERSHVCSKVSTSRGDRREDIYFSEADREAWLALFAQVCARFNRICHAYCLMTNHYHLIIEMQHERGQVLQNNTRSLILPSWLDLYA